MDLCLVFGLGKFFGGYDFAIKKGLGEVCGFWVLVLVSFGISLTVLIKSIFG